MVCWRQLKLNSLAPGLELNMRPSLKTATALEALIFACSWERWCRLDNQKIEWPSRPIRGAMIRNIFWGPSAGIAPAHCYHPCTGPTRADVIRACYRRLHVISVLAFQPPTTTAPSRYVMLCNCNPRHADIKTCSATLIHPRKMSSWKTSVIQDPQTALWNLGTDEGFPMPTAIWTVDI